MFNSASVLHLHQTMFTRSLMTFCTDEQREKYLRKADYLNIIGCYAQTEVGHGSNVAGLETTATFDQQTDSFVIHTPTIKATKFWPGTLGVMATHAIVFARCISNGNDYGVQPFMVPIRSLETHKALPGVRVGDVGQKIGYSTVDNGWLSFDQYRIPRENMLSKFAEITKDGDFELKADPRMLYQIMVQTRLMVCAGASMLMHKACMIATRYSVCRR